jgi:hypothetical protein
MKQHLKELRSKGYWQTRLLPVLERTHRLPDKLTFSHQLRDIAVNFRGWDYPHVDLHTTPVIEQDRVWQFSEWRYFHELWCAFQSGQFLDVAGMRHDYGADVELGPLERVEPGQRILGIGDTVFRMTEIVHFASRYADLVCPGEGIQVRLEAGGLKGRRLVVDNPGRGGTSAPYVAGSELPFTSEFPVAAGATPADLARIGREQANSLFELFGFRANEQVLQSWQAEMIYFQAP